MIAASSLDLTGAGDDGRREVSIAGPKVLSQIICKVSVDSELVGVRFSALFGVCGVRQAGAASGYPSVERRYGDPEILGNLAGRGSTGK